MNGCILLSRKLIESEIWNKPPLYIKVWIYLLLRAQFKDYGTLKRGQVFTSIPEIRNACSWLVGYRKETPTKDQIFDILQWLRNPREGCHESNDEGNGKATMITTAKATHGIVISIDNYCIYQDFNFYESNDEGNGENSMKATAKKPRKQRHPDNINEEGNNKDIYNMHAPPGGTSDKSTKSEADALFEQLWELYPKGKKKGKADVKAAKRKALLKIGHDEMKRALERFITDMTAEGRELRYWMQGSTFFNGGYIDYLDANFEPNNTDDSDEYEVTYD